MKQSFTRTARILFFALIFLVTGCFSNSSLFVNGESGTTTGFRYPSEYNTTLNHFEALQTLTDRGTFPVPGLEVTEGLYKDRNGDLASFFASNSGMVPQGITIANGYKVISAYSAAEDSPSVLYVSPLAGDTWTTISLFEMDKGVFFRSSSGSYPGNKESINHVGGVASDDEGNIYIAKSGKRTVARISYDRLVQAASYGNASVAMSYDAELPVSTTASFLTWYRNKLWVGVCTKGGQGMLKGYSIGSSSDGVLSIEEQMSCNISGRANGAAFCEVNGHECLALNVSSGRNSTKPGYISEMWLYEASFTDSSISISRKNKLTLPPMAEEIEIEDGIMYTLFESGATLYSSLHPDDVCDYIVDRVCKTAPESVFTWTDPKYNETEMTGTLSGKGAQFDHCTISQTIGGTGDPTDVKEVTVSYNNNLDEGSSATTGFLYSDEMLLKSALQSSGKPNTDIAKMSVALASAAYDEGSIENAISALDCDIVSFYNYGRNATFSDNDFTGFSVARKRVFTGTTVYTLYFVTVRGTPGSAEWFSNFNLGSTGKHTGFYRAESEIYDVLEKDFFASDGSDASHRKILVTGHSRGAAVANILAADLSQSSYSSSSNVFGYTFACPAVSKTANESMNNIYNYNYKGDLIPALPLERWGYGRNGHTYELVMDSNAIAQFKRVFGKDFSAAAQNTDAVKTMSDLVKNEDNYPFVLPGLQLVACILGNQDITSKKAIITGAQAQFSIMLVKQLAESVGNRDLTVVADDYKGECTTLLEQVNAGIRDIDEKLENVEDEDERARIWSNWCSDNYAMLSSIVDLTAISVTQRSDLDRAATYLAAEATVETSTVLTTWQNVVSTLVATGGKPKTAVTHGHMPGTYVIGINSMYFGYEGWSGNSTSAVDLSSTEYGNITSVGTNCFNGCSALKALTMPDGGIDYVGNNAFSGISTLSIIHGELQLNKYVGDGAFSGCTGISKLVIGDTATKVGSNAFSMCTGIRDLTLPVSLEYDHGVNSYYSASFYNCSNIETIKFTLGSGDVSGYDYSYSPVSYSASELRTAILPTGLEEIPESMFNSCGNLASVNIPGSVTAIGDYAFSGCSAWNSDEALPSGLKSIGDQAFYECSSLSWTWDTLPSGLTYIGSYAFQNCSSLTGALTIPGGVGSISQSAFYNCTGINKLVIGDTTTSVEYAAFNRCTGIRDLTLPVSLEYDHTNSFASFYDCSNIETIKFTLGSGDVSGYDYSYSPVSYSASKLRTAILPEGLKKIPESMFNSCYNLTSLNIPGSVTAIGASAFINCSAWNSDEALPSGLKSIGNQAFYECSSLSWAWDTLPSGLTSIGSYAFQNCTGLTGALTIPAGVGNISYAAFYNCTGISKLVIGDTTTTAGASAFSMCTGIRDLTLPVSLEYDHTNPFASFYDCKNIESIKFTLGSGDVSGYDYSYSPVSYSTPELTTAILPSGLKKIPESMFNNCGNLTSVNIPGSVTTIGDYAFTNCSAWNSDEALPSGLKSIGDYAFNECSSLSWTWDTLPSGLTSIGLNAFQNCTGLTGALTIPGGVGNISQSAFYNCTGISKLVIGDTTTSAGASAFSMCTGIRDLTLPVSLEYDHTNSFASFNACNDIETIKFTLGSGDVSGYDYSYSPVSYSASKLRTAILPTGLKKIPQSMFSGCYNLTSVNIPGSVTAIGDYAFSGCSAWNSDEALPSGLKSIGDQAFYECSSLSWTWDTLPSGLTYIGSYAFQNCTGLTGALTIPAGIGNISQSAFYNCTGISKLVIEDTTTSVGFSAFNRCTGIRDLTLPVSLEYDHTNSFASFYDCKNIETIKFTLGSGDVSGYDYSYSPVSYSASKLKTAILPTGLKKIPQSMFNSCGNLASVNIPGSVTTIGDYAFSGCSAWEPGDVTLSEELTRIGSYAFSGVGINRVLIPAAVNEIGSYAFPGGNSFKIYGERGSEAETYANANNNGFIVINEIIINGAPDEAKPGSEHQLTATMCSGIDRYAQLFDWFVNGCVSEDTVITGDGLLTIGDDESAADIKVKAERGKYSSEVRIAITGGTESTDLAEAEASEVPDAEYSGEAIEPEVTITLGGNELTAGDNYTVEYRNNTDAGEASIICKGKGKYSGTLIISFNILKAQNEWTEELTCSDVITGNAPEPKAEARFGMASYLYSDSEDGEYTDEVPEAVGEYYVKAVVEETDNYSGLESAAVKFSITGDPCSDGHDVELVEANDSTCSEEGNEEYYRCVNCGKLFADEAGETELEEIPVIAKKEHTLNEGAVTEDPTCTEEGVMTYTCAVCGETVTEVIPANGHTEEIIPSVDPTCTGTGLTEGKKCSVCGAVIEEQEEVEALGHDFGEWEHISDSSCTEHGYDIHTCGRCGLAETRELELAEHEWESDFTVDTEPSCTTEGSQSIHCSNCTAVKDSEVISALGHDYRDVAGTTVEPSCVTAGKEADRKCSRCGEEIAGAEVPALGHDWSAWTELDEEQHQRVCGRCNEKETSSHNWDAGKVTTPATYEQEGEMTYTCADCGATRTDVIPVKVRKDISKAAVTGIADKVYTGKALTQSPKVKIGSTTLKSGTDYKLTYKSNKYVGQAKVTITGTGAYKGSITRTFKINPKPTTVSGLTASSKGFTVKWKKLTSQTSGYEIQYALNSKFTSGKKTIRIKSNKTTSKKVTGLKASKKYYVKIRTYRTVSGKKYYSAWSKVKAVTTKK